MKNIRFICISVLMVLSIVYLNGCGDGGSSTGQLSLSITEQMPLWIMQTVLL